MNEQTTISPTAEELDRWEADARLRSWKGEVYNEKDPHILVLIAEVRRLREVPMGGWTIAAYKTCPKCSGLYDGWQDICLTCKVTLRPATHEETDAFERMNKGKG